jgi:predicted Zn-dependent protease
MRKLIKLSFFILVLSIFSIGGFIFSTKTHAESDVFAGHWDYTDKDSIRFMNNVRNNTRLQSLVGNGVYDSWNNQTNTINLVSTNSTTGRYIDVTNVNFSSVTWSGKAEGSSSNWDSNFHYYGVNIKLNEYYLNNISEYTDWKITGVVAHEFGHALGLQHRTTTSAYLMYPNDGRTVNKPNSYELATLDTHYSWHGCE